MARKLNKIFVIDVEATCWEGDPPVNQRSEIIEIGLCILEKHGHWVSRDRLQIVIKPVSSEVTGFCTELTGWTEEALAGGMSFGDAMDRLRDLNIKKCVWASWGDYDRKQFERDAEYHRYRLPFGPAHINVKILFALMCGLPRGLSVAAALRHLNKKFIGRAHKGVDDAHNIAKILAQVLNQQAALV